MARVINTRGRFGGEPPWPQGGMVTKRLCDYQYDVQQYTGYAVSNNPKGQWDRGRVVRFATYELRPSGRELYMYDPTDPNPRHWRNTTFNRR